MSDLTKDLSELVRRYNGTFAIVTHPGASFIRTHHATIQQNAEDAKRLKALERAIERVSSQVTFHTMTNRACIEQFVSAVCGMADEILREGKPHDQD